jgi:predicted unusual protein kinase regulating ubiquinone biosynthesis (AarF/ABC1/UbiB family)
VHHTTRCYAPAVQSNITELVTEYADESIGSVNIVALVNSLTAVIYENHLFLPPGVTLLLRMLGELEGTAKQLNPSFGLFALIRPQRPRTKADGSISVAPRTSRQL